MSILNASNENSLWTICFADNSLHPQPSYLLLLTSYILHLPSSLFPLPSYILHLKEIRTVYSFLIFLAKNLQFTKTCRNFAPRNNMIKEMSTKEKEVKAKEFWEYYETTQGTITITDPVVLD